MTDDRMAITNYDIVDNHVIQHYGTKEHSGRYPWGSGEDPFERHASFLGRVAELESAGLSPVEVAKGMGMTTTQLRAQRSIAVNEKKKADQSQAQRLKTEGKSNVAIGKKMGINESSVRSLLNPSTVAKADVLVNTANFLKDQVDQSGGYIDVGRGSEQSVAVSRQKLLTALNLASEDGYNVHYIKVPQLGTNHETTTIVLGPPNTKTSDIYKNLDKIKNINGWSEDGGKSYVLPAAPKAISSNRISVKYGPDGGADKDGVIELRRNVDDISLGAARYAQVRVLVDGTHYLKGMAMYADDLPDGTDIRFNTNKNDTGNKLDAMKKAEKDTDGKINTQNPFSASIKRQRTYTDSKGKEQQSALNIVSEEGDWLKWSKSLSSQVLSKQSPALAKKQLDLRVQSKVDELNEINTLTNPSVRKKLLESFADGADSYSVNLKAAALPRQSSHVILPISGMKDTEVYAPNYKNGEKVVLIRHPHGGIFEIPELTVNNKNPTARSLIGNASDAVGISPAVAERMSGADFDGDTVLVIPNNNQNIKSKPALRELKNFDPKLAYPKYDGMKIMSPRTKQVQMGEVSNLITDMTINGANDSEIARAVKHSMVVIDAEKHELNYRQSAKDNNISELKAKYQGSAHGGASTLISRAKSEQRVEKRKNRPADQGGPVDLATGERKYVPTGESYVDAKGRTIVKTDRSTKLAETSDAHTLVGEHPTLIEEVYADHSNKLKALANEARKEAITTKSIPYSPSAKATYAPEVAKLTASLNLAKKNAPLERQAQILANTTVKSKVAANPNMDKAELKKIQGQALAIARLRTGARKPKILITDREWDAIQAGAISASVLDQILDNTDLDEIKKLATPRAQLKMTPTKTANARLLLANGYTQAEVAEQLGVSVSTLRTALE